MRITRWGKTKMDGSKNVARRKGPHNQQNRHKQNEKFKKFIGNKFEGQGFADKRKRKIQYEYMKMMKKERLKQEHLQGQGSTQLHKASFTAGNHKKQNDSQSSVKHKAENAKERHLRGPSDTRGHTQEQHTSKQGDLKGGPRNFQHRRVENNDRGQKANSFVGGKSRFSKAAEEHRLKKEQKLQKRQEYLKKKEERDHALQEYRKKKKENFKKLCKRTSKGQPVMKDQIEYLLQKIEKQVYQK